MEQVRLLDEQIEKLRKRHDQEIRELKEQQRRILADADKKPAPQTKTVGVEKALAKGAGK